MEAEIIDFDKWLATYKPEAIEYVAVFDPDTGSVKSVGPSHAFETEQYKISIDSEIAQSIINAEIRIHNCVVDIHTSTMEIAEIKTINKIDDLLHRIISVEYSKLVKPEVYLEYNLENKTLTIELSNEFGGTKEVSSSKPRKCIWAGDTEMTFYITDYNDPNLIFDKVCVTINDLIGQSKICKNLDYQNFSVYTRRLFKNYVIEYK
jgi:hypothetical protein